MKETSNYKLSQWDEEDRILREDFNGDNGKIDAALQALNAAKANQTALNSMQTALNGKLTFQHLGTFSANISDTGNKKIYTPGVNYADCLFVLLEFKMPPLMPTFLLAGNDNNGGGACHFLPSGYKDGGFYHGAGDEAFILLMPLKIPDQSILTFTLSGSTFTGQINIPAKNLTCFSVRPVSNSTAFSGTATVKVSAIW